MDNYRCTLDKGNVVGGGGVILSTERTLGYLFAQEKKEIEYFERQRVSSE